MGCFVWEISVLGKCFQSLGIKSTINLYIYIYILLWLTVVYRFSPNVTEEIKHGCKDLKWSLISNGKFVGNIPGWDAMEDRLSVGTVDLKICV